jgi:hypothetical protein
MVFKYSLAVRFVLIVIMGCMHNGCRKDSSISVSGLITDPNQAIPVEGVKVELWTQQIEAGIFSANYIQAGTASTGSDGRFLFNIDNKNYTGIRLIFSRDGYYGWETEVNLDKLKNDLSHYAEYQLLPKALLQIRVKNNEPFNSDDYFEFRILNGYSSCPECCKGEKYQFTGMVVDQTITCQTAGCQEILIQWSKRKNKEQIFKTENIFIKAFETTNIELNY